VLAACSGAAGRPATSESSTARIAPERPLDRPSAVQDAAERPIDRASDAGADEASQEPSIAAPATPVRLEVYRKSVEGYPPEVILGNQVPLSAARSAFATYINSVHNRIHPHFVSFLATLDHVAPTNPISASSLSTLIEMVIDGRTGRLLKMGVVRPSGVTAFDVGALDSVSKAAPFGEAPDAIRSPNGNVYVHWQFARDPIEACSIFKARPFILTGP
jgi:hypothetical protein